jgi:hypothetical protein
MSAIDISAVKAEATKQINDEFTAKARIALVKQMRIVADAEAIVRAEKMKQEDLEAQIAAGTF